MQTVVTLLHLNEVYSRGPFLLVVPLSTVSHWKREFEAWTHLNVVIYQGYAARRGAVRAFLASFVLALLGLFRGSCVLMFVRSFFCFCFCFCFSSSMCTAASVRAVRRPTAI